MTNLKVQQQRLPLKSPLWSLGLMSGTSLDGIDAALIYSDGCRILEQGPIDFFPYPFWFQQQMRGVLGHPPLPCSSHGQLIHQLTDFHCVLVQKIQRDTSLPIQLIGFHGQTIFHAPPHTYQWGDGTMLAQRTGIPVVFDFRSHDCDHGGQGAPLVPIYHQALLISLPKPALMVNIGGIANITWVGEDKKRIEGEKDIDIDIDPEENSFPCGSPPLIAFDTGPGNALMDDYMKIQWGLPFDEGGVYASQGIVDEARLNQWKQHPYFQKPFPKSLDRKAFDSVLKEAHQMKNPYDALATLTFFTAWSLSVASQWCPGPVPLPPFSFLSSVILTGGGARNKTLVRFIQSLLPGISVVTGESLGIPSDFVEAQAFAFLAVRHLHQRPLTFPLTTGVKAPLTGGKLCLSS